MNIDNAEVIAMTVSMIPKGKVATYGQVARMSDLPGYARFVSRVLATYSKDWNLPWQRVIRSDGKIAERALGKQRQIDLLTEEHVVVVNGTVDLSKFQWHLEQ